MVGRGSDEEMASEDEPTAPVGKKFRFADLMTEVKNGDVPAATELLLNSRNLVSVESLEPAKNLKKVEVKDNRLTSLEFLEMNHGLCWLALAKNSFRELKHLQNMSSLAVLDISDNKVKDISGLAGLSGLKALIAARNRITRIDGLTPKQHPALETIVLSHNQVSECALKGFASLRKLSLANNQLHSFPKLSKLPQLAELRLNGNKLTTLDACVTNLPKLSIFEVGNNLINEVSALEPLRGHLWVKSLSLAGNKCVEGGVEAHEDVQALLATLPKLEIVNNRRQEGAGSSQKKKNKKDKRKEAEAKPVAAQVSVHGRSFDGKKTTFADSDEEADEPQPAKKSKAREDSQPVKKAPDPPFQLGAKRRLRQQQEQEQLKLQQQQQKEQKTAEEASEPKKKKRPLDVTPAASQVSAGGDQASSPPKKKKKKLKQGTSGEPETPVKKKQKEKKDKAKNRGGQAEGGQATGSGETPVARLNKKKKKGRLA